MKKMMSLGIISLALTLYTNAHAFTIRVKTPKVGDVLSSAGKVVTDVGKATEKAAQDVGATAEKAAQDVGATAEKAARDSGRTTEEAIRDLADAGKAIVGFTERQVSGYGDTISDAERRLREGKVIDAIWHLASDPTQKMEENAFTATQESEIIRVAGQTAASAYGGPGGAAAYAAWQTYKLTGDPELAIRVGILSGTSSAALGAVGEMPSDQIVAKTILAGAVGGLAVAAAGGNESAIIDGFVKSGGMVLIQDGYQRVTTHKLDARSSEGQPYCMATVGADCSPDLSAYITDDEGNILFDDRGMPRVDIRKTDPLRPHVGTWATEGDAPFLGINEQSGLMLGVSKVPGMNAMSIFHDQWAVSWEMSAFTNAATIIPATVLTYIGTGGPYFDTLQSTAIEVDQMRQEDLDKASELGRRLDAKAKTSGELLNWKSSIVDLLKLLNARSDLTARQELGKVLKYPGDLQEQELLDAWLYPRVLLKVARDGEAFLQASQ